MTDSGESRIPVAVLGATGAVGQRFVRLLADHPWFHLSVVAASERSAGQRYADVVDWQQEVPIPDEVADMTVGRCEPMAGVPLVLSALDASVAGPVETSFARAGILVVSNARSHRMERHVPLLIPEVNPGHLDLLDEQEVPEGGGIITNPNCSTIGLAMVLGPLDRAFGVESVHVVSLQALSGAGLPGIPALSIQDNVIPFIAGEEEKIEAEPRKILGRTGRPGGGITEAELTISAQCTRVPVTDGHTAMVSIGFRDEVTPEDVRSLLSSFRSLPQELGLPSAPRYPIHVFDDPSAPQPRLHRNREQGMAVSVGRVRECPLLDVRMAILSHNTLRGAAGGALLCAELAIAEERISGIRPPVPTDDR